jgi:hypothetical protein
VACCRGDARAGQAPEARVSAGHGSGRLASVVNHQEPEPVFVIMALRAADRATPVAREAPVSHGQPALLDLPFR